MHIRKYLSIFLISLLFAIAGCSPDSTSGISEEDRLPDTDNDNIVDKHDPDMDGDGTLNKDDTDTDGDGTSDATDPTPDGPGGEAPTPDLACTSANILPPKDGITGNLNTVSWELLPKRCELGDNPKVVGTASAGGVTTESDPASLGELTTNIILPHDCDWSGTQSITYDFSEIGNALGDTSGNYTAERDADVGSHPRLCKKPPVLCTSVTFTAPEKAKFNSSYELTWRLSPEGCIPHNGNEELTPLYWGRVQAPEIDNSEQLILDPVPGWPPLDGKATIDVPDS